jgi:hypothetical protein
MQTHAMASKPFVLLGEFWPKLLADLRRYMRVREKDVKLLHAVGTPEEAVEFIKNRLKP